MDVRSVGCEESDEDEGDEEDEANSVDEKVPRKNKSKSSSFTEQDQMLKFRPAVRVRIAKDLPSSVFFDVSNAPGTRKSLIDRSLLAQASLVAMQEQAMLTLTLPRLEKSPPRVERNEVKWKAGNRRNAPMLTDHSNSSARKYGAYYLPVEKWQSEERAASWAKKKRSKEPPKEPVPEALPERKIDVDVYSSKAYKAYLLRTGRHVPHYLERIEALDLETGEETESDPGAPILGTVLEDRTKRRSLPKIMSKSLHVVVSEKKITGGRKFSLPPIRPEKSCIF
mmetsp:Transcript_44328/g.73860  ORF Transcript_44328/g.73860 Transcript_44328/m.73860 type:complete len:282 (-) Transcript_44328:84-929(-)